MKERTRILLLVLIMSFVALGGVAIAVASLYRTAFDGQQRRLREIVSSNALLIESVAAYDLRQQRMLHPADDAEALAWEATLAQIRTADERFAGFGETGEFTLARHVGDQIVFVLRLRRGDLQSSAPVLFSSELAEPMRRALSGQSGTVVGLDYRGKRVMAAYQPIRVNGLGLVAKVDLAEVRRPFVWAGLQALGLVSLLITAGTVLFLRVGNPIIAKLEKQAADLGEEVDERRRAEHELRELTRTLERRVRERTVALEEANRELEEFAYTVSHDLRAPLRAISGFADIVAQRYRNNLDDQGRHYVDNIVEATGTMDVLINDLLRYARLGRLGVSLGPTDIGRVLDSVLDTYAEQIREAGADIQVVDDLPVVRANETLLGQILSNLIGNAITYRRAEGPPEIRVACDVRDGHAVLAVKDNGIGIDERFHDKIFGLFQRLHADDAYPGTGIGLAVAAKAAALMDGRIWVESERGRGSTFFVALELNEAGARGGGTST